MCFSANVSFGAGIVLSGIGLASIKKTQYRSQILFAAIPLVFAVQQITEGFLWVCLPNPASIVMQKILTYTYIFFAQIVWPILVPFSILLLEKNAGRKKILKVLAGAGIFLALYLAYCLFFFPVRANIAGHHISYFQDYPSSLRNAGIIFYALATIGPELFSTLKGMWVLGLTILISYIITAIFFEHYVLSVWCFFSSLISISVYAIIAALKKNSIATFKDNLKKI
ncbi:MAG: hypothetical protein JWO32_2579 [Bacteroidetes bacterium]|nr:hypothetical protein [Bacteroidota bacterium]